MDKSSEEEVVKEPRGVLRSISLIAPCLCDGNSPALTGRRQVLMERVGCGGGNGEEFCLPPTLATKEPFDLR